VEILVPKDMIPDGTVLLRGVRLTGTLDSPAVDAVAEPEHDTRAVIEVMCDVDHDDIAPGMTDVRDALRAEHDEHHTGPQQFCDNRVCRAANDGGVL
jgi:hypothetical protein